MEYINIANLTTTTPFMNTTSVTPSNVVPNYVGYIALSISVFFLGSNYLPVKQFETGDGMFFQLMLTSAIWTVGFFVNWIKNFPQFYALPMLGGFLWTTGNLNAVPIIKLIGLGMGTLFWNTILLVLGWAIARFGWFGVKPEIPAHNVLNYVGVIITAVSGVFFLFVKTDAQSPEETRPLLSSQDSDVIIRHSNHDIIVNVETQDVPTQYVERFNPNTKRFIGIFLACLAGVLYAFTFTPALYVQDNYTDASQDALNYVFSLYTGIFISSIFYFAIYCLVKKNRPSVYPKVVLPALVSGVMWAIGNCSFFVANNALSQAVTFPIVSSGPSVVSALWGVLLYKEVRGSRNFVFLILGFIFTISGSIICGFSK